MGSAFFVLCVLIGGYAYITDSNRVAQMAESSLSALIGAPVKVDQATLSIFEGLRLDGVHIYADNSKTPDSLLFSAKTFNIQYNPASLLRGTIDPTSILAVDPHVHVIEDADTGRRNYSRLLESRAPASMPTAPSGKKLILPKIVLRNAQVDYTRVSGGNVVESSSIAIEGHLEPVTESKIYTFRFQSRGRLAGIGPMVEGNIVMGTGELTAKLLNFEFGADVKTMLPPEVRKWWEEHDLAGHVDVPLLTWSPAPRGGVPGYRVEIELQGVTLMVHPQEWMGALEHRALRDAHDAFNVMNMAGLGGGRFAGHLANLVEPTPLQLKQVHGRFIFTHDQSIQIQDLNGWVEEFPFKISGRINGYSPDAPAQIRIASSELHDIEIPAAPRYLNSLPPAVREIYDRFRPRGVCRFWIELNRPEPGVRPIVTGDINILDGNFTFDKFPYPLRKTSGHILLQSDPSTHVESMKLEGIRGQGVEGGPNANAFVEIGGTISPLGPDSRVEIQIQGKGVVSEPALFAAFPPQTRQALAIFDAPGKGEFPKFGGGFECNVERKYGLGSHWVIQTDIHLENASGSMVGFPYPMSGVSGLLKIFDDVDDDHIELRDVHMTRGDATLSVDGTVYWPDGPDGRIILKPDLKFTARNVPIDQVLLDALPPARREWLVRSGATGRFDLDGALKPASAGGGDMEYDLRVALRNGSLWPVDGVFAVSDVEGTFGISNRGIKINNVSGRRGNAELNARGEVNWQSEPPQMVISADAKNLLLDPALYRALPPRAQAAWNQMRPAGTVDAALQYTGHAAPATGPTTQEASSTEPAAGAYELLLTPRHLSATPLAVPYRLDQLAGAVSIRPNHVVFRDITALHGDAKVRLSGQGILGTPRQDWDFKLSAENAPVDDDLRKALPQSLTDLLESLQVRGRVAMDFSKLRVAVTDSPASTQASTTRANAAGGTSMTDADFALKLDFENGSMDVGVPLSGIKGRLDVAGASRSNRLAALGGRVDVDSLALAGRPVTRFKAELIKKPGQDQLTIGGMEAAIAKGSMAGQIDYVFPETGPSRYVLDVSLLNADVRELVGDTEGQDIQGLLKGRLAVQGVVNQPASRRGSGLVEIDGQQMYKIPLILGLLQITNLSLPMTSPFTQATAQYSIDGMRVTFEKIVLRNKEMMMQGDGNLDFNTKQVKMTFVTDSTTWPKLPVIGDLIQGARHELLQIKVRGTLQEPKVSAGSMNTLTTTVDEVLRGDEPEQPLKSK
jgi:hypothetical protein